MGIRCLQHVKLWELNTVTVTNMSKRVVPLDTHGMVNTERPSTLGIIDIFVYCLKNTRRAIIYRVMYIHEYQAPIYSTKTKGHAYYTEIFGACLHTTTKCWKSVHSTKRD